MDPKYLGPMFLSYGQPIGPKVVPFGGSYLEFYKVLGGAGDLVSKVISRVIIGVTPFRVLITLLITYLLSPLPLQVIPKRNYFGAYGNRVTKEKKYKLVFHNGSIKKKY